MIIGPLAPAVQRFDRRFLANAPGRGVWASIALPLRLHGLLLAVHRHTLHALGQATLVHWLCAGSVCRWLARLRFPVERWYEHACRQLLARATRLDPDGDGVVSVDGTDTKRGGLAKVQNTRRYGQKPQRQKGGRPPTPTHTLLFGLLLLPCGLRLPLPRQRWYTRAYAQSLQLPYRTPSELAVTLWEGLRPLVPSGVRVVVLADSLFDGQRVFTWCQQGHGTFLAKRKGNRTCADAPGTRLLAYGKSRAASQFRRCRWCRGREATAGYRRQEPRRPRAHEKRVYAYHSERRRVSTWGEAQVVYSWKSPAYAPQPRTDRRQFATLVTNDLQLSPRKVVEYYELRWQLAVFFRELKGPLGLQDYRGTQFACLERSVTLVLLGYLVLEYQRLRGLQGQAKREEPRGGWSTARTAVLLPQVRREAVRVDLRWIEQRLQTPSGRRQLHKALQRAA